MLKHLIAAAAGSIASQVGKSWTNRETLSPNRWRASTPKSTLVVNNKFWVFGNSAQMFGTSVSFSDDGTTWTYVNQLSKAFLSSSPVPTSLFWTGSQYVIFGRTNKCFTSPDGINWTERTTNLPGFLVLAVAGNGTTFVAIGELGSLATSTDGVTWTTSTGLSSTTWGTRVGLSLAWSGSVFVAGGVGGGCATSSNGMTWTYQASWGSVTGDQAMDSVVWIGTRFVAACRDSVSTAAKVATSTDGVTWTLRATINTGSTAAWSYEAFPHVAYSPGLSLLVMTMRGPSSGSTSTYVTSPDGIAWTTRTITDALWYHGYSISAKSNRFLVCATNEMYTSTSGTSWTPCIENLTSRNSSFAVAPTGLAVGPSGFLAVGAGSVGGVSQGRASTSPDGINWTYQPAFQDLRGGDSSLTPYFAFWTGQSYVSGGVLSSFSPFFASSADGISWTRYDAGISGINTGYSNPVYCGVATASKVVIGGGSGLIAVASKSNLSSWTWKPYLRDSTPFGTSVVYLLLYHQGYLVALSSSGNKCAVSTDDATTWTYPTGAASLNVVLGASATIRCGCSSPDVLVVGSSTGQIAMSPDGAVWTSMPALSSTAWGTTPIYSIVWTGQKFVIAGGSSKIASSRDLVTWSVGSDLDTNADWLGITAPPSASPMAFDGSTLVVLASQGRLATSTS